jgi:hypothetical protein
MGRQGAAAGGEEPDRMTKHELSADDRRFRDDFESFRIAPAAFDHRGHIRLAYTYLAASRAESALDSMRAALLGFLRHHGVDVTKYHETITRAWILAVRHFMERTPPSRSADEFIARNPIMLDSKIMLTHYSADLLFSPEARARFVEPDLDPIPRHEP